jgi:hypothetical protein
MTADHAVVSSGERLSVCRLVEVGCSTIAGMANQCAHLATIVADIAFVHRL